MQLIQTINKGKHMTKEKKIDSNESKNFMESLKANESLKTVLSTALKNTQSLMSVLLPKISLAIKDLIVEFNTKNKGNTKTSDSDLIQVRALREHAFNLVNYNRKQQLNTAFEMVVTRAIRLALMATDYSSEFNVDTKTNSVFVMSKIATPYIVEKLEGQKSATKKRPNTSTELVEINTGIIDKIYRVKYPTKVLRRAKTKDESPEYTLKDMALAFSKNFKLAVSYATNRKVDFFDLIDDDTIKVITDMKKLLDTSLNQVSNFNNQFQVDIDGDGIEKRETLKTAINQ
jgi:hypothetical protein